VGRAHAARADGSDGDEGRALSAGCGEARLDGADVEGHQWGVLPAPGERDSAAGRNRRTYGRSQAACFSARTRLHVLWTLSAGLRRAGEVAPQSPRQALDAHELRADGAHRGPVDARQGGDARSGRVRDEDRDGRRRSGRCHVAERPHGEHEDRTGEGRRPRGGGDRDAAALAQQRAAESERAGRQRAH